MKRKLIAILAVLALALAACGDDDDPQDNDENATQNAENDDPGNDDPGNDEPGNDEPGNDEPGNDEPGNDEPGNDEPGNDEPGNDEPGNDEPGNDEPGNDEPGNDEPGNNDTTSVDGQFEELYTLSVGYDYKFFAVECECDYEELEYDSPEDCKDGLLTPEDGAALGECVQGIADTADDPPAAVGDLLDCQLDIIEEADTCHDGVDDSDMCSEDHRMDVAACDAIAYGEDGLAQCEALIEDDDAAQSWLASVNAEAEDQCGMM